jgi:hypothetical protein
MGPEFRLYVLIVGQATGHQHEAISYPYLLTDSLQPLKMAATPICSRLTSALCFKDAKFQFYKYFK